MDEAPLLDALEVDEAPLLDALLVDEGPLLDEGPLVDELVEDPPPVPVPLLLELHPSTRPTVPRRPRPRRIRCIMRRA